MNGNRSRYSTNPTFTMQKRGLFKKAPSTAPEKPDFTQAQDPMAQQQTLFSQPSPMPVRPVQGPSFAPSTDLFSSPVPAGNPLGMQNAPNRPGAMGMPPTAFPGQPPAMQNPMANPFPAQPAAPGFSFGQPSQNLPPLGNQSTMAPNAFSPHAQGFAPPMPPPPAQQPVFGGMNNQPMQPTAVPPMVQPANPYEPSPLQQPQMNYNQSAFAPQQPAQPVPPRQPMDPDSMWKIYLFALLPALFIPCLFVPESMNVLRYLFIALCVAGIGILWFRKMFSDNGRLMLTILYSAACIALLSMLFMGGSPDPKQPDTADPNQQQAVQTFGADGANGGAVGQPTFSPTPEPTPTIAPISEAQTRLEAFMTNWSGARIEDMVRLVQPSWASAQDNPSNRLFVMLGNRTPLSYTIEEISGSDTDSSRTVSMTANIDKNNGKDPTLYRFMVLMVKEGGEWYVDPNSLASNDSVQNSEETNVVNNSQNTTAENWTIAPRQTVTPAPAGSQLLYYNPDGGSMYHMDQYCPSIRDEYLPLGGSFPYAELGNHRDLTPCLKCNAPTQTLPPEETGAN